MSKYSKIADVEENLDNEHDQLEFQNFVLNSAEQNLTSGNFKAQSQPTQNRDNQNFGFSTGQPNNNNQDQNKQQHAFYTLEYYMTFFDVDTNDVNYLEKNLF
ncbi:hypothetical protein HK099_008115 [Clydaea vesicula]|uniref:Uncharacterized protein n=1 Tax=Clydaea vesicula TaxID=447962 RepID=A0AAD5XXV3_9FUNG|nr:hypothetical protein HK099_008115 [Clydaea vesicula]KAJ3392230.1 hypothetical protein HDU92_008583 [Lobulomyces angularis]